MSEAKQLLYGDDARRAIQSGINKLANAVKVTLGARGKYVVLARPLGIPIATNDGVTIAKEVRVTDPYEDIGVQLMQEVASKTNDSAGDGTTTATVIAQALINEGMRNITSGANATLLVRGMTRAVKSIVSQIKALAKPVKTNEHIEQIATISANDINIGKMVAKAMRAVGNDGVITIEESQTGETFLEVVDGMQFNRGLLSPYFVNNPQKMEASYQNAYVLLVNKPVTNIDILLPILDKVSHQGRPLIIIAETVEGQALQALIVNKLKGILKVLAIKSPGYGDRRINILEDIGILTNAEVISDDAGNNLENTTLDMLGVVDSVTANRDTTTIVVKHPNKKKVKNRVSQIKSQIECCTNNYDKEKLKERAAKLLGGVGVINVGAPTDAELKALKFKVEDALNATRSAVEEGIVEGGGCALVRIAADCGKSNNEGVGAQIVYDACKAPVKQIAQNAGVNGEVVVTEVIKSNKGYNADTGEYEDLIKSGVIDPAKVLRCALENAASTATILLQTETLIAEEPDNTKK